MCSLGLGVQWVGWLYTLIVVGGGWVTGWWGMGVSQSVCVCGAGCVLVRSVDRVCVRGGGGGWRQWWVLTELDDNDDDLVCVHWDWVCNELDDYIDLLVRDGCVTGWLGESDVCGAGLVLVRSVDCVCVCVDEIDDDLVCVHWVVEAWVAGCVCVCGGGGGCLCAR